MDREQQILALIRWNPFISQQEIADSIGISRSAVAGYIAQLTKKGIIRGRAYVTAEESSVLCIGGANLDRKATGKQPLRLASSNPVTVTESCGGVARNIAEALACLNCRVSLFTLVGDDEAGKRLLEETRRRGVDVGLSPLMPNGKTGSYTALLDRTGEMFLAFADMDIYEEFTPRLLRDKWPQISASKLIIADTNLPSDTLSELIGRSREEELTLFIDPVSSEKAKKLPDELAGVSAIFPNIEEACELAGIAVTENPDVAKLADAIRGRGARHVFITMGSQGVLYMGYDGKPRRFPPIPTEVVEVTGAGDAFVAGVAYGVLNGRTYAEACRYGLTAAHLTLQTADSVSGLLNEQRIHQIVKEK